MLQQPREPPLRTAAYITRAQLGGLSFCLTAPTCERAGSNNSSTSILGSCWERDKKCMRKVPKVPSHVTRSPAQPCRSDEDVERYRKLREIHVEGTGVPKPVASFEEASFPGAALSLTLSGTSPLRAAKPLELACCLVSLSV